jgi:hypothetical protein
MKINGDFHHLYVCMNECLYTAFGSIEKIVESDPGICLFKSK